MPQPVVHVIFTEDGIPRWFGPEPVKGSEPLDMERLRHLLPDDAPENALAASWQGILITHRRVGGTWVLREVAVALAEGPEAAELADPVPAPDADPVAPDAEVAN